MHEKINLGILFVIFIVCFCVYHFYVKSMTSVTFTYDEMEKFLENKHSQPRKPILWIHLDYQINSRKWESFYSRNTRSLNQGYIYLTLKTIIDKCKDSFHICMIDDESFDKLNTQWLSTKHKNVPDPLKSYFRFLSKCKLLHNYGGLFVPSSFICFRDLIDLHEHNHQLVMNSGKRFLEDSSCFLGCQQHCPLMESFIKDLHKNILKEGFGSECIYFHSSVDDWMKKNITYIDGKHIGLKTKHGKPITLEMLMSTDYLQINKDIFGIWIPQDDLLKRTSYGWFPRLSPEQVLESNTIITKYLLLACIDSKMEFKNFFQIQ